MLGRSYDFGFSGWDEPPFPRPRSLKSATPFDDIVPEEHDNASDRVLLEIGLVLATPLVLSVIVTLILNATGVVTAF